jgi:AraC-like DNA-binding protein
MALPPIESTARGLPYVPPKRGEWAPYCYKCPTTRREAQPARDGQEHYGIGVYGDIDIILAETPAPWELKGNEVALIMGFSPAFLRNVAEDAGFDSKRLELPISRIALETCFAHQSHLARYTRRLLGLSPKAIRQAAL